MARSSGGGSRSGGSSSRSHSSGGRSRSSGSRSHRSSSPSRRISRTPVAGYHKYIYYDRRHRAHFAYANYDMSVQEPHWIEVIIRGIILVIVFMFVLSSGAFVFPWTHDTAYDKTIVIEDNLGVIKDRASLESSLSAYHTKTGIVPAVVTTTHDVWESYYDSLEAYALECYYSRFYDEYHWLIVYSQSKEGFNDWKFEGIIGDFAFDKVGNPTCNRLTDNLTKNLYSEPVDTAIAGAFDSLGWAFGLTFNGDTLVMFAFLIVVFLMFLGSFLKALRQQTSPYKTAVQVADSVQIVKCDYCGGTYGTDVVNGCPHCGAPVNIVGLQAARTTTISVTDEKP